MSVPPSISLDEGSWWEQNATGFPNEQQPTMWGLLAGGILPGPRYLCSFITFGANPEYNRVSPYFEGIGEQGSPFGLPRCHPRLLDVGHCLALPGQQHPRCIKLYLACLSNAQWASSYASSVFDNPIMSLNVCVFPCLLVFQPQLIHIRLYLWRHHLEFEYIYVLLNF